MTIFNVSGSGGGGADSPTFKQMTSEPYEIVEGDWGDHYTKVPDYFFMNDTLIESIEIPSGFTEIGVQAFRDCASLTDVEIPDSVTTIKTAAFNATKIKEIEFSDYITSFQTNVLENCTQLEKCRLPSGLTAVQSSTFNNCSNLTDVSIPNNVTLIDSQAFRKCTILPNITIPNMVTTIGSSAFLDCRGFTNITIPSSVTSIAGSAFSGCNNVTSLTINNNVSLNIGSYAFRYIGSNTSGVTITLTGTTPPTISSNTFTNAHIDKIIVPAGTLSTYQNATNWTAYAQYMEEAP